MHHKPQVYFGATDRQMESFLDCHAFRRALVFGVLFHGDQVVPDVFLYISNRLADLMMADRPGRAFLEACVRNGAVIPAFRRDTKGHFRDNLKEIREGKIRGLHSRADEIADLLQAAVRGKRLHYVVWPDQPFSVGYRATLERALLAESLPSASPKLEQFWEGTGEIRAAVVGSTSPDATGGFRRGDVYNSLAAYLHCPNRVVDDVQAIWSEVKDPQQAAVARRLLKWVNYCYHFNHGRMFALSPGLASLDELDTEFAAHLAQQRHEESGAPVFRQEFQFPSTEALLTVDPAYVFEVRDSEAGADYFSALAAWHKSPSEDTSNILLDALERYSSRLRGLYLERGRSVFNWSWHLRAFIPAGRSRWGALCKEAAGAVGMEIAGSLIPGIGLVSLVGKIASAVYESLPVPAQDALGPFLGIGKRVRIEAEERITRVAQDKITDSVTDVSFE